ncbi:MAG: DUF1553 domain-containing protein, partial [Planctomycetota bacterium]
HRREEYKNHPNQEDDSVTINDLEDLIRRGAPWPRQPVTPRGHSETRDPLWSFRPATAPQVPDAEESDWPLDPIDHFVLARMKPFGLSPAPSAHPEELVRRLFVDLIGLPPDVGEVESFSKAFQSHEGEAVEQLVDRLLASPHFGERWGRHWLDVARYGESNGNDGLGRNATFPHAWRYRDWTIAALNRDAPYDQFITEQIAGDLLPAANLTERNRQLVATGFLALGAKPAVAMNQNFAMDVVDDQIDTVSTAIMALSVACARCHDHKHDPIPTRDYYALAGIFQSTETLWGLAGNEKLTAPPTALHELKSAIAPPPPRAIPGLPADYFQAVETLKPALYARLDAPSERIVLERKVGLAKNTFAKFTSGRIRADIALPADSYSVSFWFRNDLGIRKRPITAYIFSHAANGDRQQNGDQIGIGGTHETEKTGRLFVWNGQGGGQSVGGATVLPEKSWHHIVLSRSGEQVRLWLNGILEIESTMKISAPVNRQVFVGARNDNFAPLEGQVAELALFSRALGSEEAIRLYSSSGRAKGTPRAPSPRLAMGARDRKKIQNAKINIDGNSRKLGESVARGFLTANSTTKEEPTVSGTSSGRLELARWLTSGSHPQTARVFVNRVWLKLFGQAIVATPDDFGVYGARPSHPQLLDHLSLRFSGELGWSLKRLIRAIVLSRTYRQGCRPSNPEHAEIDPENRYYARRRRRRLDAETMRDSILKACGTLDANPASGSAIAAIDQLINWPPGRAKYLHEESRHRSVYLCMLRDSPPPELAAFDVPDGRKVYGRREVRTQPRQSLFVLNNPWVVAQSRAFAARILQTRGNDEQLVRAVYRNLLSRNPLDTERDRALAYVQSVQAELPSESQSRAWASLCQALIASNEFRYVD